MSERARHPMFWLLVATFSALISVGVESVQEHDVSSVVLVVVALGALAGFVRVSGRDDPRRRPRSR